MEGQQLIQVSFHLARVGYHEGPIRETRIYNPCLDEKAALQSVREEFPEGEWDIWDVSFSRSMVEKKGQR